MTLADGIFSYLSVRSGVIAALGEANRVRLFRGVAPQATRTPFSVYQFSSIERDRTFCGSIRVLKANVQIDCYAKTPQTAQSVADAIRVAMNDYAGLMGNIEVKNATLLRERELEDPDPGLYRWLQDWEIWFVE